MNARKRVIVASSITVLALILLFQGLPHARERPFEPSKSLRGIAAIAADVRGLPVPIGKSRISDTTIREAVVESLTTAGLRVSEPDDIDGTPILRITLLAPKYGDDLHAFILAVELLEPCMVPRMPTEQRARCSTWSIHPRIGFFRSGKEEVLVGIALLLVDQFIDSWVADNRESMGADV